MCPFFLFTLEYCSLRTEICYLDNTWRKSLWKDFLSRVFKQKQFEWLKPENECRTFDSPWRLSSDWVDLLIFCFHTIPHEGWPGLFSVTCRSLTASVSVVKPPWYMYVCRWLTCTVSPLKGKCLLFSCTILSLAFYNSLLGCQCFL